MKCPVCGKELPEKKTDDMFCPFCKVYHYPIKCEGKDCPICKEIKFMADKGVL